jgi:hypothetical protein
VSASLAALATLATLAALASVTPGFTTAGFFITSAANAYVYFIAIGI